MASNSIVSYMKRLGSSVAYAAVDLTEDYTPHTRALFENNKEYVQSLYREAAHSVQELRQIDKIKDNTIFRQVNTGWKNFKESIKTGQFYSEAREKQAMAEAVGISEDMMSQLESLMGGDASQILAELDGEDTGSTDPTLIRGVPEITKGDIVIASTNSSAIRAGTNAIANAIAGSAELGAKTTRTISNLQLKALQQQANTMIAGFNNVSSGLHALSEFNENVIGTHVQNSRIFFEQMTNYTQENNAILKEMLDIKRQMYSATMESYNSADKTKEASIFDENGNFNLKKYLAYADEKSKDSSLGLLFSTVKMIPMMLGEFVSNPLHSVTKMALDSIIDSSLKVAIRNFDNSLNGFIESALTKLANYGKDNKHSVLGSIAQIFGYKEENPKLSSVDTSKYNKGPMQWNGIAQKALVEIIPGHLRRIEASLTGQAERVFDYQNGKWTTMNAAKQITRDIDKATIGQAFKPIEKELAARMKITDPKERRRLYKAMKSFESGVAERGMVDYQHIKEHSSEYGDDKELIALISTMLESGMVDKTKIVNLTGQLNAAKRTKRSLIEGIDPPKQGLINELLNGSYDSKYAKGTATGFVDNTGHKLNTPTTPLTDLKDDRGYTLYDYQYNILATLQNGFRNGINTNSTRKRKSKTSSDTENANNEGEQQQQQLYAPYFIDDSAIKEYNKLKMNYSDPESITRRAEDKAFLDTIIKQITEQRAEANSIEHGVLDDTGKITIDASKLDKNSENYDPNYVNQLLLTIANVGSNAQIQRENNAKKDNGWFSDVNKGLKDIGVNTNNKGEKGFLADMLNAVSIADKFKVLSESLSSLTSAPQTILTSVFTSADKFMYDFLFNHETNETDKDGNPVEGFFGKVSKEFENVTDNLNNKINDWMAKYLKDGAKGLTGWIKKTAKDTFGIDVDKRIKQAKKYGERLKKSAFNAGKGFFQDIAGDVTGTFDDVKSALGFESKPKRKRKSKKKDEAQESGEPETRARGITKNTKYGLAVVGPGEAIIPADLNPWNPHREAANLRSQAINENKIKQDFMDKLQGSVAANALQTYAEGTKEVATVDENTESKPKKKRRKRKSKKNQWSFTDDMKEFLGHFSDIFAGMDEFAEAAFGVNAKKAASETFDALDKHFPEITVGSLGGVLASTILPLGGPLMGAITGSALSIASTNKSFQEYIFGKEIVDEKTKEKTRDNSGLISQKTIKTIQKYLPDAKKYGITGALAGLILPFGPLGGMMIGAGASILKNNKAVNDFLFGEKGGLINKDRKERIKRALPSIGVATLGTLFLGPFGVMGNAVLGASLGLLSTTETFKRIMLGPKDKNGERHGGIAGVIRRNITEPFKKSMKEMSKSVAKWFKDDLFNPLSTVVKNVGKTALGFTKDKLTQGFNLLFGGLGKTRIGKGIVKAADRITGVFSNGIGGVVRKLGSAVGGTIGGVAKGLEAGTNKFIVPMNYGNGWMGGTAAERLDALEAAGIDTDQIMTDDKYKDLRESYLMDQSLMALGKGPKGEEALKQAQLTIEAYQDLMKGSNKNIQNRINSAKDDIESTTTKNLDKYLSDNSKVENPHQIRKVYQQFVDRIEDIKDKSEFSTISKDIDNNEKLPSELKKQLQEMLQSTGTQILNYKNTQNMIENDKGGATETLKHQLANVMGINPKDNKTLTKILGNSKYSDLIQNEIYGVQEREQEAPNSIEASKEKGSGKELEPVSEETKAITDKQDESIKELQGINKAISDIRDALLEEHSPDDMVKNVIEGKTETAADKVRAQRSIAETENTTRSTAAYIRSMQNNGNSEKDRNIYDRILDDDATGMVLRGLIRILGGGILGKPVLNKMKEKQDEKNIDTLNENVVGFKEGQERLAEAKKKINDDITNQNKESREANGIAETPEDTGSGFIHGVKTVGGAIVNGLNTGRNAVAGLAVEGFDTSVNQAQKVSNATKAAYDRTAEIVNSAKELGKMMIKVSGIYLSQKAKAAKQKATNAIAKFVQVAKAAYKAGKGLATKAVIGAKKAAIAAINAYNQLVKFSGQAGMTTREGMGDSEDNPIQQAKDFVNDTIDTYNQVTDKNFPTEKYSGSDIKTAFAGIPFFGSFAEGTPSVGGKGRIGKAVDFVKNIGSKLFGSGDKKDESSEKESAPEKPEAKKFTNDDFSSDELRASSNAISESVQADKTKAQGAAPDFNKKDNVQYTSDSEGNMIAMTVGSDGTPTRVKNKDNFEIEAKHKHELNLKERSCNALEAIAQSIGAQAKGAVGKAAGKLGKGLFGGLLDSLGNLINMLFFGLPVGTYIISKLKKLPGKIFGLLKDGIPKLLKKIVPESISGLLGNVTKKLNGLTSKLGGLAEKLTLRGILKQIVKHKKGVIGVAAGGLLAVLGDENRAEKHNEYQKKYGNDLDGDNDEESDVDDDKPQEEQNPSMLDRVGSFAKGGLMTAAGLYGANKLYNKIKGNKPQTSEGEETKKPGTGEAKEETKTSVEEAKEKSKEEEKKPKKKSKKQTRAERRRARREKRRQRKAESRAKNENNTAIDQAKKQSRQAKIAEASNPASKAAKEAAEKAGTKAESKVGQGLMEKLMAKNKVLAVGAGLLGLNALTSNPDEEGSEEDQSMLGSAWDMAKTLGGNAIGSAIGRKIGGSKGALLGGAVGMSAGEGDISVGNIATNMAINYGFDKLGNFVSKGKDALVGKFSTGAESAKDIAQDSKAEIGKRVKQGLDTAGSTMSTNIQMAISKIKSGLQSVIRSVGRWIPGKTASAAVQKFCEAILKKVTSPAGIKAAGKKLAQQATAAAAGAASFGVGAFVVEAGFAVTNFIHGMNNAEEMLKLPPGTATTGIKVAAGLVTAICGAIPVIGAFIPEDWVLEQCIEIVGPALGFGKSDLDKLRKAGNKEEEQSAKDAAAPTTEGDSFAQTIKNAAKGTVVNVVQSAQSFASTIADNASAMASAVSNAAGKAAAWASDTASKVGSWISDKASNGAKWLANTASSAYNGIKEVGSSAFNAAKNAAGWVGNTVSSGIDTVKGLGSKAWNAVFGKGKHDKPTAPIPKYGMGSGAQFYSQLDPQYDMSMNVPGDDINQRTSDSGCGPISAINAISALGKQADPKEAIRFAINNGYKETDGGIYPGFFQDYLSTKGINAENIFKSYNEASDEDDNMVKEAKAKAKEKSFMKALIKGPVVLMGEDDRGETPDTPYAENPHYVTATGIDEKGNVLVQDPESYTPDKSYKMSDLLSHSSIGIGTSNYGLGKHSRFGMSKYTKLTNRFGRGTDNELSPDHMWALANWCASKTNVDAKLIYGQWYHESGGFTSDLCKQNYNFGGMTQAEPTGDPSDKQPDGNFWYMHFGNPEEWAEYFANYLNKYMDSPSVAGMTNVSDYANALKSNSYYGASVSEYIKGIENGIANIPNGKPNMSLIDTSRFGKRTIVPPKGGSIKDSFNKSTENKTQTYLSARRDTATLIKNTITSTAKRIFGMGKHNTTHTTYGRGVNKIPNVEFKKLKVNKVSASPSTKIRNAIHRFGKGISSLSNNISHFGRSRYGRGQDNAAHIWDYLTGKGVGSISTAGIMGNMQAESGFDPTVHEGGTEHSNEVNLDSDAGYGLCQWSKSRKQDLANFAKSQNKSSGDLELQCDFMLSELSKTDIIAQMDASKDPGKAALIFHSDFERSADTPEQAQRRADYAQVIFKNQGRGITTMSSISGSQSGDQSSGRQGIFGALDELSSKLSSITSLFGSSDSSSSSSNTSNNTQNPNGGKDNKVGKSESLDMDVLESNHPGDEHLTNLKDLKPEVKAALNIFGKDYKQRHDKKLMITGGAETWTHSPGQWSHHTGWKTDIDTDVNDQDKTQMHNMGASVNLEGDHYDIDWSGHDSRDKNTGVNGVGAQGKHRRRARFGMGKHSPKSLFGKGQKHNPFKFTKSLFGRGDYEIDDDALMSDPENPYDTPTWKQEQEDETSSYSTADDTPMSQEEANEQGKEKLEEAKKTQQNKTNTNNQQQSSGTSLLQRFFGDSSSKLDKIGSAISAAKQAFLGGAMSAANSMFGFAKDIVGSAGDFIFGKFLGNNNSNNNSNGKNFSGGSVSVPASGSAAEAMQKALSCEITSHYGPRSSGFHHGVDFGVSDGTQLPTLVDGVVDDVGTEDSGYGNFIVVKDSKGNYHIFGHLTRAIASKGDQVKAGQVIATSGHSGHCIPDGPDGAHLHYGIYSDASCAGGNGAINPEQYDITGLSQQSGKGKHSKFGKGKPGWTGGNIKLKAKKSIGSDEGMPVKKNTYTGVSNTKGNLNKTARGKKSMFGRGSSAYKSTLQEDLVNTRSMKPVRFPENLQGKGTNFGITTDMINTANMGRGKYGRGFLDSIKKYIDIGRAVYENFKNTKDIFKKKNPKDYSIPILPSDQTSVQQAQNKSKSNNKLIAPNGLEYKQNDIDYILNNPDLFNGAKTVDDAIAILSKDDHYAKETDEQRKDREYKSTLREMTFNPDGSVSYGKRVYSDEELNKSKQADNAVQTSVKEAQTKSKDTSTNPTAVQQILPDMDEKKRKDEIKDFEDRLKKVNTIKTYEDAVALQKGIPDEEILEFNKLDKDEDDIGVLRLKAKKNIELHINKLKSNSSINSNNNDKAVRTNSISKAQLEQKFNIGKEGTNGIGPNGKPYTNNDILYILKNADKFNGAKSVEDAVAILSKDIKYTKKDESSVSDSAKSEQTTTDINQNTENNDNSVSSTTDTASKTTNNTETGQNQNQTNQKSNQPDKVDQLIAAQMKTNELLSTLVSIASTIANNSGQAQIIVDNKNNSNGNYATKQDLANVAAFSKINSILGSSKIDTNFINADLDHSIDVMKHMDFMASR